MAGNLTTKNVAKLLQVSEATIKRWADNGVLPFEKTVGGHRRFNLQTIARLRRERGVIPDGKTGKKPRSGRRTQERPSVSSLQQMLLLGDEKDAASLLVEAYLDGHSLASLFDGIISEAMHDIGDLWFSGSIKVADEHLATQTIIGALHRLDDIIVKADPKDWKAVCCAIEGDLHELPVHLAAMILESEGWESRNLGPNTPIFALREMVEQVRPQLVCIAARSIADLDRATSEFAQLRKVTNKMGASVVLGGEGFADATLRDRFPSELYAKDFSSLAGFVSRLRPVKQ